MTTQALDAAIFLTRKDVANLLRLTPRSVDRLAASGDLEKVKLGKSRSGFHRNSVGDYLAKINASAPSSAPSLGHSDSQVGSGSGGGVTAVQYGSRCRVLIVDAEGATAEAAEALDTWLAKNGFPGCLVMFGGGSIRVIWAETIGYQPDTMRKAIERVKATAVHA